MTDQKVIALDVLMHKLQREFIDRIAAELRDEPEPAFNRPKIAMMCLNAVLSVLVEANTDKTTLLKICETFIDRAGQDWVRSMETEGGIQ